MTRDPTIKRKKWAFYGYVLRLDPFFRQESGRGPCEKDQLALAKHEVDSLSTRSVMGQAL